MAKGTTKKTQQTDKPGWQSRIVGTGEEAPDQLLANPKNWRIHPQAQQEGLEAVLDRVGWVQNVVVNRRTGFMVDGHLRVTLAMRRGEAKVPVLYVDLSPEEESIVLATIDPLAMLAATDKEKLTELIHEHSDRDFELLDRIASEAELLDENGDLDIGSDGDGTSENRIRDAVNGQYTTKIVTPVYEPTGEKPPIESLCDVGKTMDLARKIMEAKGITEQERAFMIRAANRHTVFDYRSIAEYYSQASAEMQELMEASALVIIDFDKAIENGYVKLTESLMAIHSASYGGIIEGEDDDATY